MNKTGKQKITKSKGRSKQWLLLIIIIVAVAAVLVAATRKESNISTNTGTYIVTKSDLTVTVTESGSITAHKSVNYEVEVERRGMGGYGGGSSEITILEIVPQGTIVTQEDVDNGLVLCRLDSSALEDNLVQEKMSLTSDEQSLIEAREAYDIQVINNESDVSNGELRARFSLLDLQKYLGEDLANRMVEDVSSMMNDSNDTMNLTEYLMPFIEEVKNDPNILAGSSAGQSLKQYQDNITSARGNLTTQQLTLSGTRKLYDANFVSDLELLQDELSLQNREFSVQTAEINLDLFLRYDFPKNAEQYLSNYIEDVRNLNRIYAQCRSRLAQSSARVSSAEERYADQLDQVNLLNRQIESCVIVARSTGMVVYGEGSSQDTYRMMRGRGGQSSSSGTIAEGETVSPGQTVISIPDTSVWIAEVSVHETDVDKVRAGQAAVITMDAFPDRTLPGVVTEVAPLPDQSRGMMNPDLKVYETKVRIEGSYDFLKTRMSCKVEILVNRVRDAIIVPVTVVASSAGNKFCYIMTPDGRQEKRDIKTGVFNDIYVEITEGLEVGEKVLLNPPVETEMIEVDLFEGIEAIPTTNGSRPNGQTTDGGMQGSRGMGMEGRGGRGGGGMRGEGYMDMSPEEMMRMREQFGGRGGQGGGGRGGGGREGMRGGFGGG